MVASDIDESSLLAKIKVLLDNDLFPKYLEMGGEQLGLPQSVRQILKQTVHYLSEGKVVGVVPINMELTIQEAADLLPVSKPHFMELLESGEMTYYDVDGCRQIHFNEVMRYKQKRDSLRRQTLKELTQWSEELGLYD